MGNDQIGDCIIDWPAQKDNPVLEQTRPDIVSAFAPVGLFHYNRYEIQGIHLIIIQDLTAEFRMIWAALRRWSVDFTAWVCPLSTSILFSSASDIL